MISYNLAESILERLMKTEFKCVDYFIEKGALDNEDKIFITYKGFNHTDLIGVYYVGYDKFEFEVCVEADLIKLKYLNEQKLKGMSSKKVSIWSDAEDSLVSTEDKVDIWSIKI